ncbi:hypothetical protein [Fodinibius halophilus]|uniref:Uncharacterized protein n=1 Tax=Fodinibius halophilus TaxID=1736908 RepID=A0A6M1SY54_9BACT|nr:hypothetical protein [Fodinibius halophilus]NGP88828.1 hypothetical protein [Fodinibius halophilus]
MSEHSLTSRSKFGLLFLFAFIGSPILYASYLNFQIDETMIGAMLIVLFVCWALVILLLTGFKIKISDTAIEREGLIEPSVIEYSDVEAIHFGSTWSDFHLEAGDTKLFISEGFENQEDIIQNVVSKIRSVKSFDSIECTGTSEEIEKFTDAHSTGNHTDK